MTGTDKQITYATKIRDHVINTLTIAKDKANLNEKHSEQIKNLIVELNAKTAGEWINEFGFNCIDNAHNAPLFQFINDRRTDRIAAIKVGQQIPR